MDLFIIEEPSIKAKFTGTITKRYHSLLMFVLICCSLHLDSRYCHSFFEVCDFFFIWVFFHDYSRTTGLQGRGESISLTPHYHIHPLHRHLDISRLITADSSSLHIGSSRTRTGNLWFPRASC